MSALESAIPHLAVVGHPNKGKSSVVSCLIEDDSVLTSPLSGTTQAAMTYDFQQQQRCLFRLIDTPGFQRARRVLAWLQQSQPNAAQRPQRLAEFVALAAHQQQFPDEVALLTPLLAGAAILYVVDGSLPYGPEYEAEMEILRWTGVPRMALINPIHNSNFVDAWRAALGQYFQTVQVFNPLTADLSQRLQLFECFARLEPQWSSSVQRLHTLLLAEFERQWQQSLELVAAYWQKQVRFQKTPLLGSAIQQHQLQQFVEQLDQHERELIEQLKQLWHHAHLPLEREALQIDQTNLMQQHNWYLWGLSERDLYLLAGLSGALVGAAAGGLAAGVSAVAGLVVGGVAGGLGAWFASHKLPGSHWGWLPLAGSRQHIGPVVHPNFPLVVMARVLTLLQALIHRAHARRDQVQLVAEPLLASHWPRPAQLSLSRWAQRIQSNKGINETELMDWIRERLMQQPKSM